MQDYYFRIRGLPGRSRDGMGLGFALPIGLIFVVGGMAVWRAHFGEIDLDMFNAPRWVIQLVCGLLVLVGLAVISSGFWQTARWIKLKSGARGHRSEPWMSDHPWDPQGIQAEANFWLFEKFVGLLLFGTFTAIGFWMGWMQTDGSLFFKFIVIVPALILVFIANNLLADIRNRLKYGRPRIEFNTFPFFLNETLDVTLLSAKNLDPFSKLTIRLECRQDYLKSESLSTWGNSRRLCVEKQVIEGPVRIGAEGDGLRISIPIPAKGMTTQLRKIPLTYWYLHITADTPGVDFKTHFLVPIYQRP